MPKLIGDKPLTPAERAKRYYEKNKESEKARSIQWRENNREKSRAIQRKSYHKNREKNLIRMKEWQKRNLVYFSNYEHRRSTKLKGNGFFYITRKDLIRLVNSPCINCGSNQNIQIDHIIPISRGGYHGIGNLQSLCKFCNQSKGSKTLTEWRKIKWHITQR